jgi:hypothetical protein
MDAMASLATDGASCLGLGGGQIECQSMLTRQQVIAIEMKQMKARRQALKQFHEKGIPKVMASIVSC